MGAPAAARKGKAGGGRALKAGKRPGFVAFSRDAARSDDEGDAGSDMDGWIAKSDAEMSDVDDGAPASGSPLPSKPKASVLSNDRLQPSHRTPAPILARTLSRRLQQRQQRLLGELER